MVAEPCAGLFDEVNSVLRELLHTNWRNNLRNRKQPSVLHPHDVIDFTVVSLYGRPYDTQIADDTGILVFIKLLVYFEFWRFVFIFKYPQRDADQKRHLRHKLIGAVLIGKRLSDVFNLILHD